MSSFLGMFVNETKLWLMETMVCSNRSAGFAFPAAAMSSLWSSPANALAMLTSTALPTGKYAAQAKGLSPVSVQLSDRELT